MFLKFDLNYMERETHTLSAYWFLSFTAIVQRIGSFNCLNMVMGDLYHLSKAVTYFINPENYIEEKGKDSIATLEN